MHLRAKVSYAKHDWSTADFARQRVAATLNSPQSINSHFAHGNYNQHRGVTAKVRRNLIPSDAPLYLPNQEVISGAGLMSNESLKTGDWVRAPSGQTGKIVLISRLSAFVEVRQDDTPRTVPFLLSELIRVDPPHER